MVEESVDRSGQEDHFTYIYRPDGSYEPLAQIKNGDEVFYYQNHINGSPNQLVDAEGHHLWEQEQTAWGKTLCDENSVLIQAHQPLRFQGQYFDEETGLHYNTFRYYNPHCGRFISQDPIGLAGGINLYQYAPNPIHWIDPWGWARKPLGSRLPEGNTKTGNGPSNGTLTKTNTQTGDRIQVRTYDGNGKPNLDIDFGHDHGAGDPHAHDWEYPSDKAPNKKRGEGRPLTDQEKKDHGC